MVANIIRIILLSVGVFFAFKATGQPDLDEALNGSASKPALNRLDHVSYGLTKVTFNDEGSYTTPNYVATEDAKLKADHCRLTPNKPNNSGYLSGTEKISVPSVQANVAYRILTNGDDTSKHGEGLWIFVTKQRYMKLKNRGKMNFNGIALLVNSRTISKEAVEVFVGTINFDKLGTPESTSIGGCSGKTWYNKLLDSTDFTKRSNVKFTIKDGKMDVKFALEINDDWTNCITNLDLTAGSIKGDINEVIKNSYITFASRTDQNRMAIHDVLKVTAFEASDELEKVGNRNADYDKGINERYTDYYHSDDNSMDAYDEFRVALLSQFLEHELHKVEERFDTIFNDIKEREQDFDEILKIVQLTIQDSAGLALADRISKIEEKVQSDISEKTEKYSSVVKSMTSSSDFKGFIEAALDKNQIMNAGANWVLPFIVVSVAMVVIIVVIYRKYNRLRKMHFL